MMKINGIFIFITIVLVFFSTCTSQNSDTIDKWKTNSNAPKYLSRPRRYLDQSCTTNDNCNASRKCKNNKCIPVCEFNSCGENTWHSLQEPHVCKCNCWQGFTGDPYTKCTKNCTTNTDCNDFEKCENHECVEVCVPGVCQEGLATCIPYHHRPICNCLSGYTGDPYTKCIKKCNTDSDCKHSQMCNNNICTAASFCGTKSCGAFTRCEMKNGNHVCKCLPGYGGNPSIECVKLNCISNHDCPENMRCENNDCVSSCDIYSCGQGAYCDVVKGHYPVCHCAKGYIGNPKIRCEEGCESHDGCHSFNKCEAGKCISVCNATISCGKHAACDVDQNRVPHCRCDDGYSGEPNTECRKYCTSDSQCLGYEKCEDNTCTSNICDNYSCGENEMCDASFDGAICVCNKGFIRNSSGRCVEGCEISDHCRSFHETCENNKCMPIRETDYFVEAV